MVSVLLIEKTGEILQTKIKNFSTETLYRKCRFNNSKGFDKQVVWNVNINNTKLNVIMFGKKNGRSGTENKYDLPPPVDTTLFFGPLLLVRFDDDGTTPLDFSLELWKNTYEKLFGGFEDLSATAQEDEEEIDELADLPNEMKTKNGYLKDGFVTDDHYSSAASSLNESFDEETDEPVYDSELDYEDYEYMDSTQDENDSDNDNDEHSDEDNHSFSG